jgi:hypothetical protein
LRLAPGKSGKWRIKENQADEDRPRCLLNARSS